ncbi:TIR domain-containing protein [Dietzia cinnamea]|uniref:TIR domain-containing protein n=1 Tax=Dietzia cinnamea TaxID=321318 RepID=UPI003D07324A
MPSDTFKRADSRYFASGLSEGTTHSGIDTFEGSLGITTDGNKGERSNKIVQHIFNHPNTDLLLIELLNFLYVENSYADTSDRNPSYANLRKAVLDPRGISLTENGYILPDGRDIDDLRLSNNALENDGSALSNPATLKPPSSAPDRDRDPTKVFIVHGRDKRPLVALETYLLFLGLHAISWSEAVKLTGKSQPHTYDVVRAGMLHASATIVIFSPDDLARVKDAFSTHGDPDRTPQGQARPNVLLEAGMSFAMAPERTIFVKSEPSREISDIAGFNWVKLDGEWDSRLDLKNRLETAGASVRTGAYDLRDPLAGPFAVP